MRRGSVGGLLLLVHVLRWGAILEARVKAAASLMKSTLAPIESESFPVPRGVCVLTCIVDVESSALGAPASERVEEEEERRDLETRR